MLRFPSVISAALVLTTLFALTPIATHWAVDPRIEPEALTATEGCVQLAIDEHDVGLIDAGSSLEVCFVVGNVGTGRLLLRQARLDGSGRQPHPTYTVSPGQAMAVTARLNSDDLAPRGRKHVRFFTSDAACPELWLTIRGTVAE